MVFKVGFNKPYETGIYMTSDEKYIWDYKVFHKTTKEPTILIASELRTGEFVGPIEVEIEGLYGNPYYKKILDEKSKMLDKRG